METVMKLLDVPAIKALVIVLSAVVLGFFFEFVVHRTLAKLAAKTTTDLDDRLVRMLRRPMFFSSVFVGLYLATGTMGVELAKPVHFAVRAIVLSLFTLLWAGALIRMGNMLLKAVSHHAGPGHLVQPSSLPLFDIGLKIAVSIGAVYLIFVAWDMDLTAWLASAGVLGVAIGFGAKDSLANLFGGLFILADAPYKVGDFIVLEGNLRGRVSWIGVRSTRILTLDQVEITIPNGLIANGRIINESGGPNPTQRLAVNVATAYGSDIDKTRDVLLSCADNVEHVVSEPGPTVRFVSFGDSGLNFQLLAWIREPSVRDTVLNDLNVESTRRWAPPASKFLTASTTCTSKSFRHPPHRDSALEELKVRSSGRPNPARSRRCNSQTVTAAAKQNMTSLTYLYLGSPQKMRANTSRCSEGRSGQQWPAVARRTRTSG